MPKPRKGESRSAFVSRYVKARKAEGKDEKTDQSVAIAYSVWRKHKAGGGKKRKR